MAHGHFVWHDLNTTDVDGAVAFYSTLLGWSVARVDHTPNGSYTLMQHGDTQFGGIVPINNAWGPVPPHWMGYIEVDDLTAALARVPAHGGTVHMDPYEVPNVGTMAMIEDDQGAKSYLIQLRTPDPVPEGMPEPGAWCWHTLSVPDADKAKAFWGGVIGWTFEVTDYGGGFAPTVINASGSMVGDIDVGNHPAGAPGHWGCHVAVTSVAETAAAASANGGTVVVPPMDLGPMGKMTVAQDPAGAMMAFFESNNS